MPSLELSGAIVHYDSVGDGPLILCISGADGSSSTWSRFAQSLKSIHTVASYDRRGFSNSRLTGAQDYTQDKRLLTDVSDAAALIHHLSPSAPAVVIGNSSGAIVALKLLLEHPDLCKTVIAYEPPAARFLPDFKDLWAVHEETYSLYRSSGPFPALAKFAELVEEDPMRMASLMNPDVNPFSNLQYWYVLNLPHTILVAYPLKRFEREFPVYPQTPFSVEEFENVKGKLVLAVGELSKKTPYQVRANLALAGGLGIEIASVPGGHVGHVTHAEEFGGRVLAILKERR